VQASDQALTKHVCINGRGVAGTLSAPIATMFEARHDIGWLGRREIERTPTWRGKGMNGQIMSRGGEKACRWSSVVLGLRRKKLQPIVLTLGALAASLDIQAMETITRAMRLAKLRSPSSSTLAGGPRGCLMGWHSCFNETELINGGWLCAGRPIPRPS